jgi:hypothetical protein
VLFWVPVGVDERLHVGGGEDFAVRGDEVPAANRRGKMGTEVPAELENQVGGLREGDIAAYDVEGEPEAVSEVESEG